MNPHKVIISKSEAKGKKLKAVFYDKDDKKIKTINFGAEGMNDYIKYQKEGKTKADERKKLYWKRHSGEKGGVMTASTLSKYILWNKPTLQSSIRDYKSKFGLK